VTTDKTKHYNRYGWTVDETNLATLPDSAPPAAKDLVKWMTLDGRRKSLEEWLGCVNREDSKIHGKFWHIGAWTHRMAHSNPNQANIASVYNLGKYHPKKDGSYYVVDGHTFTDYGEAYHFGLGKLTKEKSLSPVDEVKALYDSDLRACWTSGGDWQVGTDAAGIQLRILAHYMKSDEYAKAIVSGRKEDETDIHNLNRKALGPICKSRDVAKTFN